MDQDEIRESPIEAPEPVRIEPFSMSRFVSLWRIECEHEIHGNLVHMWEPLHCPPEVTKDDRARWEYDSVTFYNNDRANQHWVRVNRHLMFDQRSFNDVVILPSGLCVEITTAQIIWREPHQRWFIRWSGYSHSRLAKLAKAGCEAWMTAG